LPLPTTLAHQLTELFNGIKKKFLRDVEAGQQHGGLGERSLAGLSNSRDCVYQELALWEGYLSSSNAAYFAGLSICLADISLFPYLAFAVRRLVQLGWSRPQAELRPPPAAPARARRFGSHPPPRPPARPLATPL
jgi:glutathione S-transferase